jgi:Protein of unknown function (DUF1579)
MNKGRMILGTALLGVVFTAWAQPPAPAKPGPEHKKLDYFAGRWSIDGDMKAGPWGPAGKMTATETCAWFEGGFTLTCSSTGVGPTGKTSGLSLMGYSGEGKHYTFYGIDSTGWSGAAKGRLEGDTWTFASESTVDGKPLRIRWIMKQLTPDSYTFKSETSLADAPYAVVFEGKQARLK